MSDMDNIFRPPPPKPQSEHALYVDDLLRDGGLRLKDCECEAAFKAFRESIQAESSNPVGIAFLLLKLGKVQRDIAEGLDYSLERAVETHRRAVELFAAELTTDHDVVLKARHSLALTLIAKGDTENARIELQEIIDLKFRDFPQDDMPPEATIVIQEKPDSVAKAALVASTLLGLDIPRDHPGRRHERSLIIRRYGDVI